MPFSLTPAEGFSLGGGGARSGEGQVRVRQTRSRQMRAGQAGSRVDGGEQQLVWVGGGRVASWSLAARVGLMAAWPNPNPNPNPKLGWA